MNVLKKTSITGCMILVLLSAETARSQEYQFSERPKHLSESLKEHGVPLDHGSLLKALSAPDATVRSLAALKLLEDADKSDVPSIKETAAKELDPEAQLAIASGLWSIGDDQGRDILQQICSSTSNQIELRSRATKQLIIEDVLHPGLGAANYCLPSLIAALANPHYREYWSRVITLASQIYITSRKDDIEQGSALVLSHLSDEDPSVRLAVGQALAQMHSGSSSEQLSLAIMTERDPVVKASLQRDYDAIKQAH